MKTMKNCWDDKKLRHMKLKFSQIEGNRVRTMQSSLCNSPSEFVTKPSDLPDYLAKTFQLNAASLCFRRAFPFSFKGVFIRFEGAINFSSINKVLSIVNTNRAIRISLATGSFSVRSCSANSSDERFTLLSLFSMNVNFSSAHFITFPCLSHSRCDKTNNNSSRISMSRPRTDTT